MTIVIALNHPKQKEFLEHVLRTFVGNGIAAEDLAVAADTFACLQSAREIEVPEEAPLHLGHAKVTELGPNNLVVEVDQEAFLKA